MLRAVPPPSIRSSAKRGHDRAGDRILFFLPWLDRSPVKSIRYRGTLYKSWLAAFVVVFLMLGYLGVQDHRLGPVPRLADFWIRATSLPGSRASHDPLLPVLPADAVVHGARPGEAGPRPRDGEGRMRRLLFALLLVGFTALRGARGGQRLSRSTARRTRPATSPACRPARALRQLLHQLPRPQYMRYNRLTDLGLTEAQIRDNLMFTGERVGDTMQMAMERKVARMVRRAAARPLGGHARARRRLAVHVPAHLLPRPGYGQRLEQRVFPNAAMPHVLWQGEWGQAWRRAASRRATRSTTPCATW
jgi:hypothetical protein